MAQPIPLTLPPRDPQHELEVRLKAFPAAHAEAMLAAYEVLQLMHDKGVLELMRGTLGGGEVVVQQAVAVVKGEAAIRRLATRGLDAGRVAGIATCRRRLHVNRRTANVAMVRVVVVTFSEHVCGHIRHLAGGAGISGARRRDRGRGGKHGWSCEHRQCGGQSVLGVGFGFAYQTRDVFSDVTAPSASVLVVGWCSIGGMDDCTRFHRVDVLRRWFRHDARVCG